MNTTQPIRMSRAGISRRLATAAARGIAALFVLPLLTLPISLKAQTIYASGQFSGQSAGAGSYMYNLTLNNLPASTASIETFWFAWVPGADFLPSSPTSVQVPTGWNFTINGGPYYAYGYYYPDGYSIEFTTTSQSLAPGSSISFGFTTPDSPTSVAGNSPIYPSYPVGTSYAYSGIVSGASAMFTVVQAVPEPSTFGILAVTLIGLGSVRLRLVPRQSACALDPRAI